MNNFRTIPGYDRRAIAFAVNGCMAALDAERYLADMGIH
jgi:hypothetical protein